MKIIRNGAEVHVGEIVVGDIVPRVDRDALVVANRKRGNGRRFVMIERIYTGRGESGVRKLISNNGAVRIKGGSRVYCDMGGVRTINYDSEKKHGKEILDALNKYGVR